MTTKLRANRVRRTYLGGGRIDAFTGFAPDCSDGVPRPEDWLASTTTAFNGTREIAGEGLGRLEDGRLVKDAVGTLPILVKLLDSDERLVVQAHPTVPCARAKFNSPVGKTECWYFLDGTAPDACVYLGFKPGVTRVAWRAAFEAQRGITAAEAAVMLGSFLEPSPAALTRSDVPDWACAAVASLTSCGVCPRRPETRRLPGFHRVCPGERASAEGAIRRSFPRAGKTGRGRAPAHRSPGPRPGTGPAP